MLSNSDYAFAYKMYFSAGLTPIAVRGKVPTYPGWVRQHHPQWPAPQEPHEGGPWMALAPDVTVGLGDGIGVVCGWQSGNLLVFDFETAAAFDSFITHVALDGTILGELLARGWVARTPRGGAHLFVRTDFATPAGTVFARDLSKKVLVETRGQGHQVVAPSRVDTIPPDARAALAGTRFWERGADTDDVVIIDREQFELIAALCREQDEAPETAPRSNPVAEGSLFDRANRDLVFQARARSALAAAGWQTFKEKGDGAYLTRPGKARCCSASWNVVRRKSDGVPLLKVFTSSTEFPSDRAMSPWDLIQFLEYGNDQSAMLDAMRTEYDLPSRAVSTSSGKSAPGKPTWALRTELLSEVKPTPVRWIVRAPDGHGLLPAGLCVLVGDPGAGKSTLVRQIVACVTTGIGDFKTEAGKVLFVCWEDDESSLVLPHLLACGGDPRRVHLLRGKQSSEGEILDWEPEDLRLIKGFLQLHPDIRLIVVDVLSSLTAMSNSNSNSGEDIRGLLDPLSKLGREFGVSVLFLHHQNKKTDARSAMRVAGSIQITGCARLVWLLAVDPDTPDQRMLAPVKSNIPGRSPGFAFAEQVVDPAEVIAHAASLGVELPPDLEPVVYKRLVINSDRSPITADELCSAPKKATGETGDQACCDYIIKQLSSRGELLSDVLRVEADANGWRGGAWSRGKALAKSQGANSIKRGGRWWMVYSDPGQFDPFS